MANISAPVNVNGNTQENPNYTSALVVLTSLFFMWGFLTVLNDILIPHLKAVFTLNYFQAMLIQFSFFGAYFIVSMPAGYLVNKFGYKNGIIIGLLTSGIGCILFYPAASYISYPFFLMALFILASGITILQVAANPYVAILGPARTASSRLNLTQAFNSLGTTLGPLFGAALILSAAVKTTEEMAAMSQIELQAHKLAEATSVQIPYLGLAAVLFIIAAIIASFKLPKIEAQSEMSEDGKESLDNVFKSAWSYPHLVLGAIGIFLYVGAEVAIGSFLVNYLSEDYILGITEAEAGRFISYYWGGAMIGRFIGSALLTKINPGKALAFNAGIASLLVVITMLTFGNVAAGTILLVGLFNSIMFANIFTLSVEGLGKHTGQASGILCAAIVGGAIIPVVQGHIADTIGIHHAFVIPVLCYLYIVFYGLKGHAIRKKIA